MNKKKLKIYGENPPPPPPFCCCSRSRFTDDQSRMIDKLAYELGVSRVVVIQRAMSLFSIAAKEIKRGNQICIGRDDIMIKEIVGVF